MTYTYDRAKTASDAYSAHTPYKKALTDLQAGFLFNAGETLAKYADMLHGRLRDGLRGSWQYGTAKPSAFGWEILVYANNETGRAMLPEGVEPLLVIRVAFEGDLDVELVMGHRDIIARKKFPESASASDIGMFCGAAWEKLLTGSVDYGD
jgi:hypothetical protein